GLDDDPGLDSDRSGRTVLRPASAALAGDDVGYRLVRGALQHFPRGNARALGVVQDGAHASGGGELAVVVAGAGGRRAVRNALSRRAPWMERVRRVGAGARRAGDRVVRAGFQTRSIRKHSRITDRTRTKSRRTAKIRRPRARGDPT